MLALYNKDGVFDLFVVAIHRVGPTELQPAPPPLPFFVGLRATSLAALAEGITPLNSRHNHGPVGDDSPPVAAHYEPRPSSVLLGVSLVGVETVLRLERDAWSTGI